MTGDTLHLAELSYSAEALGRLCDMISTPGERLVVTRTRSGFDVRVGANLTGAEGATLRSAIVAAHANWKAAQEDGRHG